MEIVMLTQDRLKELLTYNEDTGAFIWKARTSNRVKVGSFAGNVNPISGYVSISLDGRSYYAHRLAWVYMYGEFPKDQIDHINHIRNDNRAINLSDVTNQENGCNQKLSSDNKFGVTGVCWHKKAGKFQAYINDNGKRKYLGLFSDINDAAEARLLAMKQYGYHSNHGK